MKLHIFHEEKPWDNSCSFWFVTEAPNGDRLVAQPIELNFQPMDKTKQTQPTLSFRAELAVQFLPAMHQAIIKSGWVKPPKDESIEAIRHHLEDMRKIAFEYIDSIKYDQGAT